MPEVEVYDSKTRQTYKLPFQKIVYIESLRNYLYIHLAADDVVKVRGSLTDFMEKLDDDRAVMRWRRHRGFRC